MKQLYGIKFGSTLLTGNSFTVSLLLDWNHLFLRVGLQMNLLPKPSNFQ